MPKSKHDLLKRQCSQIYLGIGRAAQDAIEMYEIFEPQHPELAAALAMVIESLDMDQVLLTKFWKEAWGERDPRWESWI